MLAGEELACPWETLASVDGPDLMVTAHRGARLTPPSSGKQARKSFFGTGPSPLTPRWVAVVPVGGRRQRSCVDQARDSAAGKGRAYKVRGRSGAAGALRCPGRAKRSAAAGSRCPSTLSGRPTSIGTNAS